MIGITITQFVIEEQRKSPNATGDLTSVINDVVTACKTIASAMRYGALSDEDILGVTEAENVQGETQKTLDVIANDLFLRRTEFGGHVAAMASEEMEAVYNLPDDNPKGRYLLLYDPVDGSSNIAENATIGTIFSILKRPEGATGQPDVSEFLQPGYRQICAGYAIYGPSTMIVMTTGNGVNGFTLDPMVGEFVLSHAGMKIPTSTSRYFINAAMGRRWGEYITRYVEHGMAGRDGPRGRDFDLRWSAGAVADIHRILIAGGIYLSPGNTRLKERGIAGNLRLLYEVNPLSFLVEQAGGMSTNGEIRPLEIIPETLHQRCPAAFGSRDEIEYLLSLKG